MLYVIIVNWNGWRDTIECLDSLLHSEDINFRVLVCDNGSADSSLAQIRDWAAGALTSRSDGPPWRRFTATRRRAPTFALRVPGERIADEWLTVIRIPENLGFAGGNNVGLNIALDDPACDYILLLNNDTVVAPTALSRFKAKMAVNPSIAMCGPTLLFYDEPDRVQALGGFWRKARVQGGHLGLGLALDALPEAAALEPQLNYIVGAALLARRSFFARVRQMYDKYFLYFEELDLASQLAPSERLGWCSDALVYHKEGQSAGTNAVGRARLQSLYYLSINLLRHYRRRLPPYLPLAFARLLWEHQKSARAGDRLAQVVIRQAVRDFFFRNYRRPAILDTLGAKPEVSA